MKGNGKKMKQYMRYLIFCLFLCQLIVPALALLNPSAVYCSALGYRYTIENSPSGEVGYCFLNDGKKVDAWRFLQGKEGAESGICAKKGYRQKIVNDPQICIQFMTESCAVCVLPNGGEIEVTKTMNLSFSESKCGDHRCGFPENHLTCPADCPSGSNDEYCDGTLDGRCDRDCRKRFGADLDCPAAGIPVIYLLCFTLIIPIAGIGYFVLKKSKKK